MRRGMRNPLHPIHSHAETRNPRRAVVLFNLGGPDSPEAVRPFLYNLFSDKAIISLPSLPRHLLAWLIARRRAPTARAIYAHLGGKSPILEQTQAQATALESLLRAHAPDTETRAFIAMRYWHPRAAATAAEVAAWNPDETILLPLYPQYSTTTTQSALEEWQREATRAGIAARRKSICCYPGEPAFIRAHAESIAAELERLQADGIAPSSIRLLFSAHGLPKKIIRKGDPYQAQVESTCAAVAAALPAPLPTWRICYQSRVGPLEWIGPSLDAALTETAAAGQGALVVPIAFVSEHSETLVELDIEYRKRAAEELALPFYRRVPALGTHPAFIQCLADMVARASDESTPLCPWQTEATGERPRCAILDNPAFQAEAQHG